MASSLICLVLKCLLVFKFDSFCKANDKIDSWISNTFYDCTFQLIGSTQDLASARLALYGSSYPIFVDIYSFANNQLGRYNQSNLQNQLNNGKVIRTGITRLESKHTPCLVQVYFMLTLHHPILISDSITNLMLAMALSEENPHFIIYKFQFQRFIPVFRIILGFNRISLTSIPIFSIEASQFLELSSYKFT